MRTLVTGATGFIGGHLARTLVERGHSVRTFARNPMKARALPAAVEVRVGDLSEPASLEGITDDIDVVFHLGAAMSGPWERHRQITVEGTRRLLTLAAEAGVKRFVHVSSLAVYDRSRLSVHDVIAETSPLWTDLEICGPYARGKIEAERLLHKLAPRQGIEYVIARPGLVYGPGHTIFEHLGIRLGRGTFLPIGGSRVRLPLVNVESVVDALLRLAEAPGATGRAFNIVDDDQVSKASYIRALSATNCRRYRCIGIPAAPLKGAARAAERLRASGRAKWLPNISSAKIRARTTESRYDSTALRETTGWRPRHNLIEGLRSSFEAAPAERTPVKIRRVGLIGAGRIAQFHIASLRRIPGIEVTGILDRDHAAAQALAAAHDIPVACSDLDEFYRRARPDSVHILTPPQSHADLAMSAIERGIHVLLEKPMVLSLAECRQLQAAAEAKNVTVAVDHNYIADARVQRAREMIRSGALGELVHIDIFWAFDTRRFGHMLPDDGGGDTWALQLPGGPMEDLLPHPLSIALSLLDEDVEPISARAFRSGRIGHRFDDELRLFLAGRRATASITMSLSASPDDLIIAVHGTRGTLKLDIHNLLMIRSRVGPGPKAVARGLRVMSGGGRTVLQTMMNSASLALKRIDPPAHPYALLREHYSALASGRPLPTDMAHGRRVLEITRAVWPELSSSPDEEMNPTSVNRVASLLPPQERAGH
jgi:predicted dehydrogenase/nucleoside-diphosphate-sugar epimerase